MNWPWLSLVALVRGRPHGFASAWITVGAFWGLGPVAGPIEPPRRAMDDDIRVLITEVLIASRAGDTAFVELTNVAEEGVCLTTLVLRIDTLDFPLPALVEPLPPGGRVVIRFDGRGTAARTGAEALRPSLRAGRYRSAGPEPRPVPVLMET